MAYMYTLLIFNSDMYGLERAFNKELATVKREGIILSIRYTFHLNCSESDQVICHVPHVTRDNY